MAKTAPSPPSNSRVLIILFLLLSTAPKPSHSPSYSSYRSLVSLAHSLTTRVANLRASRGDISGSHRARLIAQHLERGLGLGFLGFTWSGGWDYLKNYAWSLWRDVNYADLYGAVSDANKLLSSLGELTRLGSDAARAAWVGRNYQNFLGISNSLFQRLLKVFRQRGALREVVETVQIEVAEGGLLRDCLEVGGNDMKGLLQIFRELALQFYSTSGDDL
ncbi:uncharacterized protein LOC132172780 [Corylus avellana]|uniref:uncharacterized protein LOC132172780 n=1 Tax=Corylus avellana TaxID=13451 RepID=UPI001E21AD0D|nr:uncharacterized protein LOC132172780 [Corylus avellana]